MSWDGNYDDYYLVKLADGSRKKILEKAALRRDRVARRQLHPLLRRRRRQLVHGPRRATGRRSNLTAKLGVKFQSETDDRPEHPTPYGRPAGPTATRRVLLYDRYDIWEVKPDGSGGRRC